MSSDRPKIPMSETKNTTSLTQEIKLPSDKLFLRCLREPISWYDNFIASCHVDENKASKPLTFFIYDCTELSRSGTWGGPLEFPLGPYHFGAACPLPVDLEKPKTESFVLIGTKYENKELTLNCRIFEKEEKEFKFSERSFTLQCPIKEIGHSHSYAFVMPETQALGFIYNGKAGFLIDIENQKLISQFDLPKSTTSSTFLEPDYLAVNDTANQKITAWQITQNGLKLRGSTETTHTPISSWSWRGGNFLAVAEYRNGDSDGLIVGYKIDRKSDHSLSFRRFGMVRGEDLFDRDPKIIRNKLFFKKRPDRGTFEISLVAYDPSQGVTRPVADHPGKFFSTCAGMIVCSEHDQNITLIPFSSPPIDPPIKTFIRDDEIPNALAQTPAVASMPQGVLKIIESYASTPAFLFNPMRSSMKNEKELIAVLKNYAQNTGKNKSENKGDAKSSGVVLGVTKLITLLEENKALSRAQCVAEVLKEFSELKNLVETSPFSRLRMSKEKKELIGAIEQLQWADDPGSRPWYR